MSEKVLIENCSPTMAGLKTGSLFSCEFKSRKELLENIRRLNVRLVPRGVRMVPVKFAGDRALIYMYRPKKLSKDLCDSTALSILSTKLYPTENAQNCVAELVKRLKTQEEFPHEIGIFLGYPLEDVEGFMNHKEEGCKCVGTWKVYGDVEQAEAAFRRFKRCTMIYQRAFAQGWTLEELTVAS